MVWLSGLAEWESRKGLKLAGQLSSVVSGYLGSQWYLRSYEPSNQNCYNKNCDDVIEVVGSEKFANTYYQSTHDNSHTQGGEQLIKRLV